MQNTMLLRNALVPYLYSLSNEAYLTGVAPLRPLYYAFPDLEAAYIYSMQYFFGPALLVAPITQSAQNASSLVQQVWIPPGRWLDWTAGRVVVGPVVHNASYGLADVPVFAEAGSVVPMRLYEDQHQTVAPTVLWQLTAPLSDQSGFVLYEDDGVTMDYQRNHSCRTNMSYEASKDSLAVLFRTGCTGLLPPAQRSHVAMIAGETRSPKTAQCNGKTLSPGRGASHYWVGTNSTLTGHSVSTLFVWCMSANADGQVLDVQW